MYNAVEEPVVILPGPVVIDQVKVQEEVMSVPAAFKALAVKVTVAPPLMVVVAEWIMLTDAKLMKPVMVTALELSAFPAVSVTEDAGFTVVPMC